MEGKIKPIVREKLQQLCPRVKSCFEIIFESVWCHSEITRHSDIPHVNT